MFNQNLERLENNYLKNGLNGLSQEYTNDLDSFFSEDLSLIDLLTKIKEDVNIEVRCKKYWVSKLTSLLPERDDFPILANILNDSDFNNSHTNIRKVFRCKDFADYGPKVKIL